MTLDICVAHAHDRQIGYGRMGVDLSKALQDMGLNVYDWTEGWEDHIPPAESVHSPGRARTAVFVSPGTHVQGWLEGQYTVAYTMWEATELPEANRDTLHEYDLVVVPSKANLELYSRYHPNVKMVPLGVGPEWHYRPRDALFYDLDFNAPQEEDTDERGMGLPMSSPSFNFLCAGAGPLRKGIDLVAQAFQRAFPQAQFMQPRPELIYKTPLGVEIEGVTQHIPGYLSEDEELDLYQSAHCFVSAARGEGFGLQPLQAIAQGCPTILVNAHGHTSFAHFASRRVAGHLVPAPQAMGDGDAGEWWECDIEELAEAMFDVYCNYAQYEALAWTNSVAVHQVFSWAKTARGLVEAIGEENLTFLPYQLRGTLATGSVVPYDWHALEHEKYLIRVTDDYRGTVNSVAYHFTPGQDYYDVADIKRQIARMGLLDQSCVGADGVVKADPRLSGTWSYCSHCGQRLNSVPTKADDILAALEA